MSGPCAPTSPRRRRPVRAGGPRPGRRARAAAGSPDGRARCGGSRRGSSSKYPRRPPPGAPAGARRVRHARSTQRALVRRRAPAYSPCCRRLPDRRTALATHAVTGRSALPVPELDAAEVERWRAGGGELIELLGLARERLGGLAAVRIGPEPTVLVTAPEAVQHVLARNPDRYVKRSHRARLLIGDGLLAATGDAWKRQRRLLQSQFTGTGMRRYERRIAAAARTAAQRWAGYARSGEVFDVGEEMRRFALDTIWRALTGHPLDDATARELTAVAAVVAVLPSLPADEVEARGSVAADLARIDAVARHAVAAARDREAGPEGPGLLRVLVDASETYPQYSDRLLRDELVTLLVAGHETTATTLTWLYLLLDRHPAAREEALAAGPEGSAERREAVQGAGQRDAAALPVGLDPCPRHAGRRGHRRRPRRPGGDGPAGLPVPDAPRS
ncbi:predicted protein, partial [Streptomyces sp. C]